MLSNGSDWCYMKGYQAIVSYQMWLSKVSILFVRINDKDLFVAWKFIIEWQNGSTSNNQYILHQLKWKMARTISVILCI